MTLPKGTMNGLLKILAPLLIWMSAGWYAYPFLIGDIASAVGENIDIDEVRSFSFIMAGLCLALGIIFLIIGFTGKKADDLEFKRMSGQLVTCHYCRREVERDENFLCPECGKVLQP